MTALKTQLQLNPTSHQLIQSERKAVNHYTQLARVEIGMAKEKANVRWLDMADGNNKFYHNAIRERRVINNISCIYNREGVKLVEFSDIEAECLNSFCEVFAAPTC